jgi:phosphatidylserine/phosphatidylglycerophosphate/cardiolipin synthase-like enzyme
MNDTKILNTTEFTYEIEMLLKNCEKYLIILSPYLKINPRLSFIISNIKVKTYLIYRDTDLKNIEPLKLNDNITIVQSKNLHAKAYINENNAIIGSLNLYDYSQVNNFELGVKISKKENLEQFNKLL